MDSVKEKYKKAVVPKMKELFGYQNALAMPRIKKVVLNVGVGRAVREPKFLDVVESTLTRISGQKPVFIKAKKSISNFKIKKGMIVGAKVTLRGGRMYNFLDKLINATLPRVRDFRGLPQSSVSERGNLSIGFKENIVFPEIKPDEVESLHGMEVNVSVNAKNKQEGLTLFKLLGFPFQEE